MVTQNECAIKEPSLLFDLFKTFDQIESSHKSSIFLNACATFSEVPSNVSTMAYSFVETYAEGMPQLSIDRE